MEVIFDSTVSPTVEGHLQRTVALVVAEVAGTHVRRQLTDVSTAPVHSAFGLSLVDLIEPVLERSYVS